MSPGPLSVPRKTGVCPHSPTPDSVYRVFVHIIFDSTYSTLRYIRASCHHKLIQPPCCDWNHFLHNLSLLLVVIGFHFHHHHRRRWWYILEWLTNTNLVTWELIGENSFYQMEKAQMVAQNSLNSTRLCRSCEDPTTVKAPFTLSPCFSQV